MLQADLDLPDLPGCGVGWELLLPAPERARRCTGAQVTASEERRRSIVAACVHLGTRRVAEAFGVSREVVRALRAEAVRTGELDQLKEEAGRRALSVADRVLDRLEDEVDQLPRASLAITYGILKDKGLLLTGQPTSRVEHVVTVSHEDLNSMIESLPAAEPVIEVAAPAQNGLELPAAGAVDPIDQVAAAPASDYQSHEEICKQMGSNGKLTSRAESGQTSAKKGGGS